ncbi:MAG: AAA family ATPase, partial [Gammaproteobacteria bacterium]|nr:AAA family ATPase [Gammaproteobacteria bacterium]
MRIQALNLAAFGPFSERSLEFDGDALQIVYGPNEAGKSSALRALKALLFGIETNTRDNFVHSYSKLRIAGRLRAADGQELRFMRRKGRKNTLLSADGEVLSEQALMPFLQGVTAPLFETLFGLDHQALVQGGEEILQQQGEVGQALFSAALGSHALHRLLADLDAEADAIFRPRGSTQQINAALKNFTELNKQVRECSLPSAKWEEQQRALERTSQALAELQSELAGDRIALNRLRRIQRVLPKLARRRELLQELDSMGEVVTLSADFAERRQQAVNGLELAQGAVARAVPYLNELQHGLNGLAVNRALLEQAEAIEDLHARLGSHRSALRERPQLEAERRQRSADAESRLREIRPELALQEIAALRPLLAAGQIIFDSGKEHAVLTTRLELATSNLQKTETLIKIIHRERAGLPQSGSPDILQK